MILSELDYMLRHIISRRIQALVQHITAYIGPSNLSNPALSNGLEWNLKVSEYTSKDVVDSFKKTFESYWNDEEFRRFEPGNESNKKELKESLSMKQRDESFYIFFDLKPYSHQK